MCRYAESLPPKAAIRQTMQCLYENPPCARLRIITSRISTGVQPDSRTVLEEVSTLYGVFGALSCSGIWPSKGTSTTSRFDTAMLSSALSDLEKRNLGCQQ